ncbi:ferritin-like domain-containing protein [Clostridium frigoris]|uniref:Ferritin-like domain-containing protein n=1 Tax=Clostridium frigoris TaxID=205327 RepID=A0ABS6BNN8_9CLOT|nr:ferritin-like domain-containing protein [Clostridium frigoris]MBU3158531.1 ferritin-like domain-containing protein [Clostridium frigoris]
MSYTNKEGQPQGIAKIDTNKLREILIAEIIAINGYAKHIANSNMIEINAVWNHILKDEKKHYGMILTLLRKYDPCEYKGYLDHKDDKSEKVSPMQIYKANFDKQIILNDIREDIKGEFEAVILYEHQIDTIPYHDIRRTLYSIINDEKEHAEHLTQILLKYDEDDYDDLE